MNEVMARPSLNPPGRRSYMNAIRRNVFPALRLAAMAYNNRQNLKRGYDMARGVARAGWYVAKRGRDLLSRKKARVLELLGGDRKYYSKRGGSGGSGRGGVLRGGNMNRKRRGGGYRRRRKSMWKRIKLAIRNVPPPNTLRVTDQSGSLGGNNVWVYRLDSFFVSLHVADSTKAAPFMSFNHVKDMANVVGQTFSGEDQIRVENAVDKYFVRAPSNTKTVLEVYVLQPKEPLPDLWSTAPNGAGPPSTNPTVCGPLYDLSSGQNPASVENPGAMQPYVFYPYCRNFPPNVASNEATTNRFDAGASTLNFNPMTSQRFRSNYRILKVHKFVLGPSDVATFKLSTRNQTVKYEDYYLNSAVTSAQTLVQYMKKSRIVMFRWHGELCQGTTSTPTGAYCNMGYSADNLLVRCERYAKVRKVVQNINTVQQWSNQGSATMGLGNNLVSSNASLREFGEDNNAGVQPGS